MSNLRVIHDNAANRATLSSSATASGLPVSNLLTDIKTKVCRSTGTTFTITATWPSAESLAAVVLAFTNLSATHTVQVQGYTNSGDSSPSSDTGAVLGSPSLSPTYDASINTGVNSFAYGGGSYSRVWLPNKITVQKLVITIVDPNNIKGYMDLGRLIIGPYWAPTVGVEIGSTLAMTDTSQHVRTDGGDLMTYVGTKHRTQSLSLPSLDATDRTALWRIMWSNGMSKPMFISLWPNNAELGLEQTGQMYGKLSATPVMKTAYFRYQSATIDIEEI